VGFNTTILFLNDAEYGLEGDTLFPSKLARAIRQIGGSGEKRIDVSVSNHVNGCCVIESHHADEVHLIAVGGNYAKDLGRVAGWREMKDDEALLRGLANKLGFNVRKKPVRKK
jgi:hypothetical protein